MSKTANKPRAGSATPHQWDELVPLVYGQLRRIAQSQLNQQRRGHTLAATELVHEAFLRLSREDKLASIDRSHFFALAAQCMRWILIDYARSKKRGGRDLPFLRVKLDENLVEGSERDLDLVVLNDLVEKLSRIDPRLSRIVELRFLGGLGIEETAEVLQLSPATVKREWKLAKAWLTNELSMSGPKPRGPKNAG